MVEGPDQLTGRPADMEQICPWLNIISTTAAVPEWTQSTHTQTDQNIKTIKCLLESINLLNFVYASARTWWKARVWPNTTKINNNYNCKNPPTYMN